MTPTKGFSIYRFHDYVAVNMPGATIYLTALDAKALAKYMNAASRDIAKCKFQDSTFPQKDVTK